MARTEDTQAVKPRRARPVAALRSIALSLGGAATQEAASAAVRGAAEGLRQQLPELDGQLEQLLEDTRVVVGRLMHDAAQGAPGHLAHDVAAAVTRGALAELEAEWRDGGLPLHGLTQRLDHLLDLVAAYAESREQEMRTPRERARSMAVGVVGGAMDRLHEGMPLLTQDLQALAPAMGVVAYEVGRELVRGVEARAPEGSKLLAHALELAGEGLVHGMARGLAVELRALGAQLRRPAALMAGFGALSTLLLVSALRRRA